MLLVVVAAHGEHPLQQSHEHLNDQLSKLCMQNDLHSQLRCQCAGLRRCRRRRHCCRRSSWNALRVVWAFLSTKRPRHTTSSSTPSLAAAFGPHNTTIGRWPCCGQTSGGWHAGGGWHSSRASYICDEHVSTCVVERASVELPPPYESVDAKLKVGRHRKGTIADRLVHAFAHTLSIHKAV